MSYNQSTISAHIIPNEGERLNVRVSKGPWPIVINTPDSWGHMSLTFEQAEDLQRKLIEAITLARMENAA